MLQDHPTPTIAFVTAHWLYLSDIQEGSLARKSRELPVDPMCDISNLPGRTAGKVWGIEPEGPETRKPMRPKTLGATQRGLGLEPSPESYIHSRRSGSFSDEGIFHSSYMRMGLSPRLIEGLPVLLVLT